MCIPDKCLVRKNVRDFAERLHSTPPILTASSWASRLQSSSSLETDAPFGQKMKTTQLR